MHRDEIDLENGHSNFGKVGQFNDACGCHREPKPRIPVEHPETIQMRIDLITEETQELAQALSDNDVVEVADALADLLYVVYGAAHTFGIDIQPIFDEVHRSNMAKVGADGKVIRRSDGKILKPEGWTPPNVKGEIEKQMV
jgi:predicted HAD superfamily Cof-like phosphohydrolase